jgi:hypothetical protein
METLTFPEPAATLWRKIGPSLQSSMREILMPDERWTMSGGTILAARWGHRSSDDIDLQLAPSAADRLIAKRCPHFMAAMGRLGATGGYQGVRQVVVTFLPSELDLWQTREDQKRHPAGSESEVSVDGRTERAESNAQILHGKAQRASRNAPVRDLYDFGVANALDRKSLETAINLRPLEEMSGLRKKWRDAAATYANDAKNDLKSVPKRFSHIKNDPAGHAANATEAATWTTVELCYENGQLKWRTTCYDGDTNTQATRARNKADITRWMSRTGVDRFIELNSPTRAAAITATAVQTAEQAPSSPQRIWSTTIDPGFDPGDRGGPNGPAEGGRTPPTPTEAGTKSSTVQPLQRGKPAQQTKGDAIVRGAGRPAGGAPKAIAKTGRKRHQQI